MSILDSWERMYSQFKVSLNTWFEEYESLYGMLDYRGKTVIDIGADFGSTCRYFLSKGASRVICYEANPVLHSRLLEELGSDSRVATNGKWDGSFLPFGDILKMDCEGCEYILQEHQLDQFSQWAIGVHRPRRNMPKVLALQEMLKRNGGRMVSDMGFEVLYVKA